MAEQGRYIQEGLRMVPDDQFFDRTEEIKALIGRILPLEDLPVQNCFLMGPRRAGSSEMAKRVYRELFLKQDKVLPFYYRFERIFHDPMHFVRDYLTTLIRQYISFRERDPAILLPEVISFRTVERMSRDRSDPGLERLFNDYEEANQDPDKERAVRLALHAPSMLTSISTGFGFMILDHLHLILRMKWTSCANLSELYPIAMGYRKVSYLFTGLKSLLLREFFSQESLSGSVHRMGLPTLAGEAVEKVFCGLCERYKVRTDIAAVRQELRRFYGIPFYMVCLIRRAAESKIELTTPESIRDLYDQQVSSGEIAFYYESLLNRCFKDPMEKKDAILILSLMPSSSDVKIGLEEAANRLSLDLTRVRKITESLIPAGLLEGNYGMVTGIPDPVFGDFLRMTKRFWLSKGEKDSGRRETKRVFPEVPILTEMKSNGKSDGGEKGEKISFGLVLPMVSETELVAARALEQVAERVDFPDEEIGKIRMALIEACINSFEHSGSKDGKIYITFTLDKEKLSIVVEDKGVSFDPDRVPVPDREKIMAAPGRGWGIELIRNLMDQVIFEDVPVGTKLRMIKYYPKESSKAQAG